MGLVDVPIRSRCQNTEETALRVLCYCRYQAGLPHRHFGANLSKRTAYCKVQSANDSSFKMQETWITGTHNRSVTLIVALLILIIIIIITVITSCFTISCWEPDNRIRSQEIHHTVRHPKIHVFTTFRHWITSWDASVQSTPRHPVH